MRIVDIEEAKTNLSRLVAAVESGAESEIIIIRDGRPVARLVTLEAKASKARLGVARGKFEVPDDIDALNPEIEALFTNGEIFPDLP